MLTKQKTNKKNKKEEKKKKYIKKKKMKEKILRFKLVGVNLDLKCSFLFYKIS